MHADMTIPTHTGSELVASSYSRSLVTSPAHSGIDGPVETDISTAGRGNCTYALVHT